MQYTGEIIGKKEVSSSQNFRDGTYEGKNQVKRHDPNCGYPNDPSLTPPEITQIAAKATRKPIHSNHKTTTFTTLRCTVRPPPHPPHWAKIS